MLVEDCCRAWFASCPPPLGVGHDELLVVDCCRTWTTSCPPPPPLGVGHDEVAVLALDCCRTWFASCLALAGCGGGSPVGWSADLASLYSTSSAYRSTRPLLFAEDWDLVEPLWDLGDP